jgi:AhpD family alkylhydroperoxidase
VSRLRLLQRADAPPLARGWYRDDGSASGLTRSLANAPDLMETLMPFLGQVFAESAVDLATKELVVVRVSQLNGCRYCLAAHRPLALEAGVKPDHVAALCGETPLAGLPARERTLVEWVDLFTLDPGGITDDLVARVLDHIRDDQLIEVAVVAGATQLLNQYCTAFDIPPPR